MMHLEDPRHARVGLSEPLRQMLIIGGTSDLSRRHLLPALTRLLSHNELPEAFTLTLTGLESMSVDECRSLVAKELAVHGDQLSAVAQQALVERISYLRVDLPALDALRGIVAAEPLLIYLATPPAAVPAALEAIRGANLHRSARIVLDKPFGLSGESARALNTQLAELGEACEVYRIDHFLYHHTLQELVRWRVRSDPLVLADVIPLAQVEIIWDETRVPHSTSLPYCGVLQDMVQSHLLQLAAIITMETPEAMTHDALARCRLDALRRMSISVDADPRPMRASLTRDKETAGASAAPTERETFVRLELASEMPRWRNVRFFLRAAKGVNESRRRVDFGLAGRPEQQSPGSVRLEVLAGRLSLASTSGEAAVEFPLSVDTESASTRLLRAALIGDDTFTLSPGEPEEAWRIVEPLLQAWEKSESPMPAYSLGASVESIAGDDAGRIDA